MKTDVIRISNQADNMEEALAQAEKVAVYCNLSSKGALHLRLLTEEALGMMRSITGNRDGEFWIENEGASFELHLRVNTLIDEKRREQLLSASSSGVNEATRGIMGKIRAFFEAPSDAPTFSGMFMPAGAPSPAGVAWSMEDYREQLRQYREMNKEGAKEAWDELEKSVVARVADDVKVSIMGRTVEMTINKKLA